MTSKSQKLEDFYINGKLEVMFSLSMHEVLISNWRGLEDFFVSMLPLRLVTFLKFNYNLISL